MKINQIKIIKKDGTKQDYNPKKIKTAVNKSADRIMVKFSERDLERIIEEVEKNINKQEIDIKEMHNIVENALEKTFPSVAKSYRDYRNYKQDFVHMLDNVYQESQRIMYIGDKENSNADSALVSTKRSLIYSELNRALYKKFFLNVEELQAINDGYIYIHDMNARRDSINCCLFNIENILKDGFEMGNIWYNEPKSLDVAFDVIGDIVMSAAAQQYGGFTVPEIDKILAPYAKKSYEKYYNKYLSLEINEEKAKKIALEDVRTEFKQGWQGLEYKFNTVGSSRGDYPFITVTLGLGTDVFEKMCSLECFKVRRNGQGKEEYKKPVLFPKIVFLYDENLHGKGKINEDVFEEGILCSSKAMYPDWLSLTGEGYVSEMYKKYGRVVSPMGCVEGKETITYKINEKLYVESFERFWKKMIELKKDIGQRNEEDENRIIDLRNKNVKIYDTKLKKFTKINFVIRNIQNNWVKVKLSKGHIIETTNDHPFETENRGIVYATDLKKDDIILVNNGQYKENNVNNITSDIAWLFGFMLCDGCYSNYRFSATIALDNENEIETNFHRIVKNDFGFDTKTIEHHRNKKGNYKELVAVKTEGKSIKSLCNYFSALYEGVSKKDRHIPNEVFSYNENLAYSFLAGMIDADGYINNKTGICQIGSTNKELALGQKALAQSLGMKAFIYENHYNKNDINKIRYRVEFVPNEKLVEKIVCTKKRNNYIFKKTIHKEIEGVKVSNLEFFKNERYSYDVSTESEHFEVSGIYSHNCRAFLSPWFERGGEKPADEDDKPVFVGRFNIGAISLHLPMILAKARKENKDFYEVLDYYLEMIRQLHIKTYNYLGEMKASTNPLGFCQGGFYGGNLKPNEKIKPLLKPMTASFGYTALNELQELYNGSSLVEDGQFAIEVMEYINKKINKFKEEDHILYAIYGTPAESLCGKQVIQFRNKYGIVEGVSDRPYVSNSFHCHVTENISPIMKQDLEKRFWDLSNGGKIQYVKYPIDYNIGVIKTLVKRAMQYGFYEGVNLSLAYCEDCGHQELNMDVCPKCGSKNLTKIERMNGYLSYSRVKGDTRLNEAKMAEIKERKSM